MKLTPLMVESPYYLPDREAKIPRGAVRVTLRGLCRRAGIMCRATIPSHRTIWMYCGSRQVRAATRDLVGVPMNDLRGRVAALRALEALAFGFLDHGARACVCGQGLFGV